MRRMWKTRRIILKIKVQVNISQPGKTKMKLTFKVNKLVDREGSCVPV